MNSTLILIIGIVLIILPAIIIVLTKDKDDKSTATKIQPTKYRDENNRDQEISSAINNLEGVLVEMNDTFNSTLSEFEKKYALIEKKMADLDLKLEDNGLGSTDEAIEELDNILGYSNDMMKERVLAIKELAEGGMSNPMIAKKLDIGTGEVNLITNIVLKKNN